MNDVFGPEYSNAYDILYSDKSYDAECDMIEQALGEFASAPVRSLLDLGCGTGNHAVPLAERGYEVIGVDRSEPMLEQARRKSHRHRLDDRTEFLPGDIRSFDAGRSVDAVLMMFAVLGYQHSDQDVLDSLMTARRHLHPGGLLIFDVWYGPAVVRQRPDQREKRIPTPDGEILRTASGTLDAERNLCTVEFHLQTISNGEMRSETQERHVMRYFFREDLQKFLQASGFELVCLGGFPEFDQAPDETTWNVLAIASAV